jgi:hypothetical protein
MGVTAEFNRQGGKLWVRMRKRKRQGKEPIRAGLLFELAARVCGSQPPPCKKGGEKEG